MNDQAMLGVKTSGVFYENERISLPEKLNFRQGDLLHLHTGRYAVSRTLGQGGFGTVYQLLDDRGESFAFKVLDLWRMKPNEFDQISARFEQGFKAGQVESKYLVKNYSQGKIAGNPYILMEFCRNGSLGSRQREFFKFERFEDVALAILHALHDLHLSGIIHRDVKPDNVLFDDHDTPKLTDFDISGNINQRMTSANWRGAVKEIWGTAVYAPPEQLNHKDAYALTRPSMDMFAFGVTCYETLTGGKYPYGNFEEFEKNPLEFYKKVKQGKFEPVTAYRSDLPRVWVDAIHACLVADPEKRVQSPKEILALFGYRKPELNYNEFVQHNEWVLKVMNGEEVGREYNLTRLSKSANRQVLRIGWDAKGESVNDVRLKETFTKYISESHATLEWDRTEWVIRDGQWSRSKGWQSSLNGTLVNQERIDSLTGRKLQHADILMIGETTLKVLHI